MPPSLWATKLLLTVAVTVASPFVLKSDVTPLVSAYVRALILAGDRRIQLTDETVAKLVYSATVGGQKLSASQQSGMPLASKQDGDTSGKSRTQADLSRTWIEGCFPAARSNRELLIMCDYSLHFVASRPARVGDKLVSTRFRTSLTRGFAAIGEPDVAVCLLPGTEVAFERDVECDGVFRFFRGRSLKQKVARFRQINLDEPTMHHDALEFPDGQIVLVTELRERQHGTVLQLPAPKRAPSEAAPTERAPVSTMA